MATKNYASNAANSETYIAEGEYCECSRCGTIYPTEFYKKCPGCGKRRTHKDTLHHNLTFKKVK